MQANAGLAMIYERVAPAFVAGNRLQQTIEQRMESLRARVPQVIQEELQAGVQELTAAVQEALPQARPLGAEGLPPLSLVVAGLFAPLQLKGIYATSVGRAALCAVMLGFDVLGLVVDHGKACLTEELLGLGTVDALHVWVAVDAALLAFTVGTSAMAVLQCRRTLADMQAAVDRTPDVPADPEAAFRVMMESHLLNGARAMIQYDRLVQSIPFQLMPVISVVDFFWQVGGWVLFFDTPGAMCEAKFLLYWSRGRGMIFLIGLVPALLGLAMTLAKAATESRSFGAALLQAASDLDQQLLPAGPAVFTVLVRAFFLRDSADMRKMELQLLRAEEGAMARDLARMRAESDRATAELEAAEARHRALAEQVEARALEYQMDPREQEFMDRYRQAVSTVLDTHEAAAAVGQAAALGDVAAAAAAPAAALGGEEAAGLAAATVAASAEAAATAGQEVAAALGSTAAAAAETASGAAGGPLAAVAVGVPQQQPPLAPQTAEALAEAAADVAEGTGGTGTVLMERATQAAAAALSPQATAAAEEVLAPAPGEPAGGGSPPPPA